VGDVELRTFIRDAAIPDTALRIPALGQTERDGWYVVTFRWEEEEVPDGDQ
jgi:hypothetical protein